jgi:hypothetical protein
MAEDFLDEVIRQLLTLAPDMSADDAQRIEFEIRRVWGGQEVYIGKRLRRTRPEPSSLSPGRAALQHPNQ